MDYTDFPSQLFYKDRIDLNSFSKSNELLPILVNNMYKIEVLTAYDFEKNALLCLNRAYYLCTIILLENNPEWRTEKYKEKAKDMHTRFFLDFRYITLSLVYILLEHYDEEWKKKNSKLMDNLVDFIKTSRKVGIMGDSQGAKEIDELLYPIYTTLSEGTDIDFKFSSSDFSPRVIDNNLASELMRLDFRWETATNYFHEDLVKNIIESVGETQEEKRCMIKFFIDYVKNKYNATEWYKNERLQILQNMAKEDGVIIEEDNSQEQSDSQIAKLNARIKELEEHKEHIQSELQDLKDYYANAVEEIPSHDKVRLELLLRFMENADCDFGRHGHKAKAATILQTITKLPISTCKNYVSNRDLNTDVHSKEILAINSLLQALGTEIRITS